MEEPRASRNEGNSLAIHLVASLVEALELKEGDEVEVHVIGERAFDITRDNSREGVPARIRAFLKDGSSA